MTQTTAPDLLNAALGYAARGWQVFPCHTPTRAGCSCRRDCGRIGKHPRTQHGLKDASTDVATLRRWWNMWPTANIGIATGTVSGLVVLDEDSYKGGDQSRLELEHSYGPLPETVQQLTGGGGVQYLFAHPGTHVKNGVETLGVGLDIRGDGGYVIAPPSLHASGKPYAWEVVHEPDDMPLAPMPAWLLALCQDTTRRETVDAGAPIPDGQRGDALFTLGCAMRGRGFTHAAILGALQAINASQCQPPVEESRLQTIAARCAQYEAGPVPADVHQRRNGSTPDAPATGTPLVIDMDTVQERLIEWLWYPYVAIGKLCILDGDPGVGKTLFATQVAANVSRGSPMPDQAGRLTLSCGAPGGVVFIATEDGPALVNGRK